MGAEVWAQPKKQAGSNESLVLRVHEECGKGVADFRRYLAAAISRPDDPALAAVAFSSDTQAALMPAEQNLVCSELAHDPEWSCEVLKGNNNFFSDCTRLRVFASFAWTASRGLETAAACRSYLSLDAPDLKVSQQERERICGLYVKAFETGDIGPLKAECESKASAHHEPCADLMEGLKGGAARCASIKDEGLRESCSTKAAMVAAMRSKDPKVCAASPWCDALSRRRPASCAPFLQEANKQFCDHVAKVAAPLAALESTRNAATQQGKMKAEEDRRKAAQGVAEFHKKRLEEEKALREKLSAAEARMAQEAAAKRRSEDDRVMKALEERKQKKQFNKGQRMEATPLDVKQQIDKVNKGAEGPQAQRIDN